MKRWIPILLILMLMTPAICSNSRLSFMNDSYSLDDDFIKSADGDTSGDSITSFSETLADDVLLYPDSDTDEIVTSTITSYDRDDDSATREYGAVANAAANTTTEYDPNSPISPTDSFLMDWAYKAGGANYIYSEFNFTLPLVAYTGFSVDFMFQCRGSSSTPSGGTDNGTETGIYDVNVYCYDHTDTQWDEVGSPTSAEPINFDWSSTDNRYISDSSVVMFKIEGKGNATSSYTSIWLHYLALDLTGLDYWSDSFADVSDWSDFYKSEKSTDGDVANFSCDTATYGAVQTTNVEGFDNYTVGAGDVIETRVTTSTNTYMVRLYYDNGGSIGEFTVWNWASTTGTRKAIISNDIAAGAIIYEIRFYISGINQYILVDYLRIGPANEMGWQHDGGTTEGLSEVDDTNFNYYFSSDGDILNVTIEDDTGSSANGDVLIPWDNTATSIDMESDYYQFFEIRYKAPSVSGLFWFYVQMDSKQVLLTLTEDDSYHVERVNVAAGTYTGSSRLYLRHYNGDTGKVYIDYMKLYSIANFTVTQSSSCVTSDVWYIESNVLVAERTTSNWMTLERDPALSVNTATYNVVNVTITKDGSGSDLTGFNWREYVGGVWTWILIDEWRGELTSGTLSDMQLNTDATGTWRISAIKFIEDASAPDIVRANVAPITPSDDESVTLSAVAYDAVEVYKVWFDAIVYPSGFSDSNYYATEQSDNLWTYSFSTMTQGYYVFKILATDGANENTLDYYSYVEFTVREREIDLNYENYVEREDSWAYSATVNQDINYYVYDNDTLKQSGSKSTGFFQITQSFVNTIGVHIWKVKFNTSADTKWVGGQYEIDSTLKFDSIDPDQDNETVVVGFRVVRSATSSLTYSAYESGLRASGTLSINQGDFFSISFDKSAVNVEGNATIVFSDGTSSVNITVIYVTVDQSDYTTYNSGGFSDIDYNYNETSVYDSNAEEMVQYVIGLSGSLLSAVFLTGLIMWWKDRDRKQREYRLAVASGGNRTE